MKEFEKKLKLMITGYLYIALLMAMYQYIQFMKVSLKMEK